MTAKFKIDFRLFAIFEVGRARRKGEAEEDMAPNDGTKLSWPLRATDRKRDAFDPINPALHCQE
jgi:hypothetical protein